MSALLSPARLALVLVAALLASALPAIVAPAPDITFAAASRVSNVNVGEPGLRLASDGAIWIHWPGGLAKSTDGGATWARVPITLSLIEGGDADLAITQDGRLLFADLNFLCSTVFCNTFTISVATSTDKSGSTWAQNLVASDLPIVDRQWLETGKDPTTGLETVYLAYNEAEFGLRIVKSHTGGLVFEDVATIPDSMPWSCFRGNLMTAPDGSVYVADCTGQGPRVWASHDGGLTWKVTDVDHRSGGYNGFLFTNVATDAASNVYASWSERENGQTNVYVSGSKDGGAHWSPKLKLTNATSAGVMPWGVGGAAGKLGVAYYAADHQGLADGMNATARWHVQYDIVSDVFGAPTVASAAASNDNVQMGSICGSGSGCGGHRNLLDFFQVRADKNGYANVAFAEGCDPCTSASGSTQSHVYFVKQVDGPSLLG